MKAIDFAKEQPELYKASKDKPALVKVPKMKFLMADGSHRPEHPQSGFEAAVQALYGCSFTLKFTLKFAGELDWKTAPLDGLWWMKDDSQFDPQRGDDWLWTLMLRVPDEITAAHLSRAKAQLIEKKKDAAALERVRLESLTEGLSAQILHIGSYASEGPTIIKLHAFTAENGKALRGKHHEIYFSDPRRTAPEKLRTLIRQPVE